MAKVPWPMHFPRLGINVIDADIIASPVVEPGTTALQAIATHFGSQMLNDDGTLNRRALREKIFAHPEDKTRLTGYYIRSFSRKLCRQMLAASSLYLLVVPLLVETGWPRMPIACWSLMFQKRRRSRVRCFAIGQS